MSSNNDMCLSFVNELPRNNLFFFLCFQRDLKNGNKLGGSAFFVLLVPLVVVKNQDKQNKRLDLPPPGIFLHLIQMQFWGKIYNLP